MDQKQAWTETNAKNFFKDTMKNVQGINEFHCFLGSTIWGGGVLLAN